MDLAAQEEQELAQAIALSMQAAPAAAPTLKRKHAVISLDDSEDEETVPVPAPVPALSANSALPSRADMERERLARLQAKESAGELRPSKIVARDTSRSAAIGSLGSFTSQPEAGPSSASSSASSRPASRELVFKVPAVRPVFSKYHPHDKDALTFQAMMGDRRTLRRAILCTYCVDPEWVYSQVGATPLVLIAKGGASDPPGIYERKPWPTCTLMIPKLAPLSGNSNQTFHPKWCLFVHEHFARLVISTANLMDFDYDTIDNSAFIMDLPLNSATRVSNGASPFFQTFSTWLTGIGLPKEHWEEVLSHLDYTQVDSKYRLVATLSGQYAEGSAEERRRKYGYPALGRALEELGLQAEPGQVMQLECQGSSIGFYTPDWLERFHSALPGQHAHGIPRSIKVVYPTDEYVAQTPGGRSGGTIFCSMKTWTTPGSSFKQLAHKSRSRRGPVLMHTKSIIGFLKDPAGTNSQHKAQGFVYIGSHNFTPSAWGKVQKPTRNKAGAFICPNTELGIVRLVEAADQAALQRALDDASPVLRPVEKYTVNDMPWIQPHLK